MSHSVKAVRYIGTADTRSISKKEWLLIKVEKQNDSIWDASNEKVLPGADFVDGAIDYFRTDPEFVVESEMSEA